MEKYCENGSCQNEAIKEVPVSVRKPSDQKRAICAACEESYSWGVQHGQMSQRGLVVEPPPREKGPEPLYRVVYTIDLNARSARQAAESAYHIMIDPESMRPVLEVLEYTGRSTTVDLSQEYKHTLSLADTAPR